MIKKTLIFLAVAATLSAQKSRPQRVVNFTAGGTANAITGTPSPALAAYSDLSTTPLTQVCFTATATSTGTVTVNLNSLGAKTLKKVSAGSVSDAGANDLINGQVACAVYLSSPDYLMLTTPSGNLGAGGGGGSTTWFVPFGARGFSTSYPAVSIGAGSGTSASFNGVGPSATQEAVGVADFLDANDGGVTFITQIPSGWNGSSGLNVALVRKTFGGTGVNHVWNVRASCPTSTWFPNSVTAFTYNTATQATLASAGVNTTASTNVVTGVDLTGCTAGGLVVLNIRRMATDAADTDNGNSVYAAGALLSF